MVLRRAAKVEWLAKVPLFERCSKRELEAIARLVHEVSLPEGHTLIHPRPPEGERKLRLHVSPR